MEERRRVTTVRQLELLVEFMEDNRDLALGRVRSKEARNVASRLWGVCAAILNAEGPARTAKEWAKVWNDQKSRVRTKLVSINANQRGTGGGPHNAPSLTALEERIANILGRDVGPLPNVSQDQFIPEDVSDVIVEQVVEEDIELVPGIQEIVVPIELSHETNEANEEAQEGRNQEPRYPSPVPSLTGQVPTTPPGPERSRHRRARLQQPPQRPIRARIAPAASALDESRALVLEIERMKGEIERMKAQSSLNNSESFRICAESFKMLARSIDRLTQKFCQQEDLRRAD